MSEKMSRTQSNQINKNAAVIARQESFHADRTRVDAIPKLCL